MGDRLTKISTRKGDDGSTGLASGERVQKFDPRVNALGEVDELDSCLGELAWRWPSSPASLLAVRVALFDIGAHLATPGAAPKPLAAVEELLDSEIHELSERLGPLADFILPGGSAAGSWAHVCRSVCRRAERSVCALGDGASPQSKALLNRLSDWLFCQARALNAQSGVAELLWRDAAKQSPM